MKKKYMMALMSVVAIQLASCDSDVIRLSDACQFCSDDEICCNDTCVHVQNDVNHCGQCDVVCGMSESCVKGVCSMAQNACGGCSGSTECCGISCVDTRDDDENCGKCGNKCPADTWCVNSRCKVKDVVSCKSGCDNQTTCCGEFCVNTDVDDDNCGSCGTKCQKTEICQKGHCVDLENPKTCEDGCGDGACCNDTCVDLTSDNENCGSCGNSCGEGLFCRNSSCQPACLCDEGMLCNNEGSCVPKCGEKACKANEICCDDECVAPDTAEHCGSCDVSCSGNTSVCMNGNCAENCGDLTLCDSTCVDIKQDNNHCGKCTKVCGDSEQCVDGRCECNPKTCSELGRTCGKTDDGCGSELDCGTCADGETCNDGVCGCKIKTCSALGYSCGTVDNGCGSKLDCGTCNAPKTCNNGVCGCKPKTCNEMGKNCGDIDDGCGNTIHCGTCSGSQTCTENVCDCNKTTCKAASKNCGEIEDGCGGKLNCGTCTSNETCQNNVCQCTKKTCSAAGKNCGEIEDGCGGKLNCGTCTSNETCTNNVCKSNSIKDTYPTRQSIKGLQPDFMSRDEIYGNAVHGVSMNLVWAEWQPSQTTSCGAGQVKYDGYCFNVNGTIEETIRDYTNHGVVVTAIVYGVPAWCRRACSGVVIDYFCAPTDEGAKHYGRFVGFLANYFNGENGHGRIADFVIHNEVNATEWFNYGCSANTCDVDKWASIYADSWNNAYDNARKEQKNAKVLISLEHNWDVSYLSRSRPVVAGETFLKKLIPKLGNRDWRLAYHSYPPNLADPAFGADDLPNTHTISFGNIGVIAGWLRKNYPNDPHAWEIQLTENGINGTTASMQQQQNNQLCQAFRNILGTPGIESFIYHRLLDIAEEGLSLGLWAGQSNGHPNPAKPAWTTYALANRSGVGDGWPSCGFEYLPYVKMTRGVKGNMHWITTRQMPSGFTAEKSWKILREEAPDTQLVFECRVGGMAGNHTMISTDPNCENQFSMGPMGYVYKSKVSGSSEIYRCYNSSTGSHFVSSESNCEGATTEGLIGYAIKL